MKLVIVESPTKAKTIGKFLGKGFIVKSSFGHIRDLPKSEMGIDIENNFQPRYVTPNKAREKLSSLKESAQKANEIILASDEDREGEAISWHLAQALGLIDTLKSEKSKSKVKKLNVPFSRIVFHEITKTAIEKALENPRQIDMHLVDAQQARRVLDRLVGYELSPFLWKKIRRGLSAGRVQSVALRLIAEREREIEKFKNEKFWTISTELFNKNENQPFFANLLEINNEKIEKKQIIELFSGKYTIGKTSLNNEDTAKKIVTDLQSAKYQVADIIKKEVLRNPPAPFTTSTLQQAAISNLGWSAKQTMITAQKLYELGYITYMRTDSVNLSLESLITAQKTIEKHFGKNYALSSPRYYKTKSKSAQEAHEAIRPTNLEHLPEDLQSSLDNAQYKLYRLIWNRTIACQMQNAKLGQIKVDIAAEGKNADKYLLRANGSTIIFDGFLKIYGENASKETFLPELKNGEILNIKNVFCTEKSTTPPPRYNEASLVKTMEEYGIGRPSTYAPTISTIFERKYIDRNEEKRLFPLEIGLVVNDTLVEHFPQIVNISFTAEMEENLDAVAGGVKDWVPVIRDFYEPFHTNLEKKTEIVKKEDFVEKLDRKCPNCNSDLIIKFGRFGKFIACSKYPECKYTEKTSDEKKLDAEFSGETCEKCGKPMIVKRGRFGAFLGCSGYPECKNIKGIKKKTGISCPKCKNGEIVEKKSKRGKIFYGCNKYPNCDFAMWNKPTGESCPRCGQPLTFAAKGKTICSNKECQFEQ